MMFRASQTRPAKHDQQTHQQLPANVIKHDMVNRPKNSDVFINSRAIDLIKHPTFKNETYPNHASTIIITAAGIVNTKQTSQATRWLCYP